VAASQSSHHDNGASDREVRRPLLAWKSEQGHLAFHFVSLFACEAPRQTDESESWQRLPFQN
jgi:hypothetical protein